MSSDIDASTSSSRIGGSSRRSSIDQRRSCHRIFAISVATVASDGLYGSSMPYSSANTSIAYCVASPHRFCATPMPMWMLWIGIRSSGSDVCARTGTAWRSMSANRPSM